MNELDPNRDMDGLMGRRLIDYGFGEQVTYLILDDGRVLVFFGLGIVEERHDALH